MTDHSKEENKNSTDEQAEELVKMKPEIEVMPPHDHGELSKLQEEVVSLQERLLRSAAEADNTRKRLEKARDDARDYAIVSFSKDLLSVLDSLSSALAHKPKNPNDEMKNIITGLEMTYDALIRVFKQHGIEPIEPKIGAPFDHNQHHAISQVETKEHKGGVVVSMMQNGYKIKDRLLRPAMVQVAKN